MTWHQEEIEPGVLVQWRSITDGYRTDIDIKVFKKHLVWKRVRFFMPRVQVEDWGYAYAYSSIGGEQAKALILSGKDAVRGAVLKKAREALKDKDEKERLIKMADYEYEEPEYYYP